MPRRAVAQQRYRAPRHRAPRARSSLHRTPATQVVKSATVTNAGTVETAPVLSKTSVTGPTTVYFENATQAKTVWVSVPAGTGDLSVDFSTKAVTFAGSTLTDAVTVDSRWWTLSPGANTIRSNVAASVTHRDAFS